MGKSIFNNPSNFNFKICSEKWRVAAFTRAVRYSACQNYEFFDKFPHTENASMSEIMNGGDLAEYMLEKVFQSTSKQIKAKRIGHDEDAPSVNRNMKCFDFVGSHMDEIRRFNESSLFIERIVLGKANEGTPTIQYAVSAINAFRHYSLNVFNPLRQSMKAEMPACEAKEFVVGLTNLLYYETAQIFMSIYGDWFEGKDKDLLLSLRRITNAKDSR